MSTSVRSIANSRVSYIDAATAQRVDDLLMTDPGFSINQLMELAGFAVATAVHDFMETSENSGAPSGKVLVLSGPGNNGGDGLVAARHLKHFGFDPEVYYPKYKGSLFTSLKAQCEQLGIGIFTDLPEGTSAAEYSIIVDALFGFSFKGPAREPYAAAMKQFLIQSVSPVLSVDIPSGWDVEKGDVFQTGFEPDGVISLTVPKLCMRNYRGQHYVGGRFVPPVLAEELGIRVPDYGRSPAQVVRLHHDGEDIDVLSDDQIQGRDEGSSEDAGGAACRAADTSTGAGTDALSSPPISVVYVTTPSKEVATHLAEGLLHEGLAACINITPGVTSVYKWEGKVEKDTEALMMIKTRDALVPTLTEYINREHPYDVPEVISMPLSMKSGMGSPMYLSWVAEQTANDN